MTEADVCKNDAVLDQWHPIAVENELKPGVVADVALLGERLSYGARDGEHPVAWRSVPSSCSGDLFDPSAVTDPLPLLVRYGYVWSSLGDPPRDLFELPEFEESDRRNIHGGVFGLHCSAPRAIENFLDMSHFPFVHPGTLGIEPHTEVREYGVKIDEKNEVWTEGCVFYQPAAAATSTGGQMTDYVYRIPHPSCVLLYKSCPVDADRMDVIGLFVRSVTADFVEAHFFLSVIDSDSTVAEIRAFQQEILAQDKAIVENQVPKLLPLDPRFETPIRADNVAIAYRRWLSALGVTYGVIPAA
jgi:phenylpropionate dioxygenase-like ring-hydroxylating dioxygenase large terminal subunit